MTNDDMWSLIRDRTRALYERVFKPFKLCKKGDLGRIEKYLQYHFYKSPSHSFWLICFLKGVEEAETKIVLHKEKPKSFDTAINDSLKYVREGFFQRTAIDLIARSSWAEDIRKSLGNVSKESE
jgi:hypothetical protein